MTKQQFFFRIFETVLKIIGVLIGFKWGVLGVASSIVITNFISKLVKILFVSRKLDIECKECCRLIVSSWRFAIIIIIVCGISMYMLPNTWGGDVLLAVIFSISALIIFIFTPSIVGVQYRDEIHVKIMSFIRNKLSH